MPAWRSCFGTWATGAPGLTPQSLARSLYLPVAPLTCPSQSPVIIGVLAQLLSFSLCSAYRPNWIPIILRHSPQTPAQSPGQRKSSKHLFLSLISLFLIFSFPQLRPNRQVLPKGFKGLVISSNKVPLMCEDLKHFGHFSSPTPYLPRSLCQKAAG